MVVLPLEGTRFAARLILANPCLGKRSPLRAAISQDVRLFL
jgi:hypothetical protein